ncbi:MAG: sulfite exporter TauE/SafE family protein [Hyphomicrobium sp.]
MPLALLIGLGATMIATAFLSGIFGMAGGMILMGILLYLLPLPDAMALHAITQMASNGSRGLLWIGHVRWRAVIAYLAGCAVALAVWSVWRYVPSKPIALLLLGVTPFLVRVAPEGLKPDPESLVYGTVYGSVCMTLLLLTGVAGPLIDTYVLGGRLDRREIVATKAICQIFAHAAKLVYFGALVDTAAAIDPTMAVVAVVASLVGTVAARPVLERLSDTQYRRWANHIITGIACLFLAQGGYLLAVSLL